MNPFSAATAYQPIGVFDSGVGGFSVLAALRRLLPAEDFIYVADTGHAPYGDRSEDYVVGRALTIGNFLERLKVKAVVIACNTATAIAATVLRDRLTVPLIAIEPALKPSVQVTRSGVVGVLGTTRTLSSKRFDELAVRFGREAKILRQPCPGLAECVEHGACDTAATRALVESYVKPLIERGADTLVLGCTHYAFLAPLIQDIAGPDIHLIEPSAAVANVLRDRLAATAGIIREPREGKVEFYSSAATKENSAIATQLWGAPVTLMPLPDGVG